MSKYSILVLGIVLTVNLIYEFTYTSVSFWMPAYFLGAWCGIYAKDFFEQLHIVPYDINLRRQRLKFIIILYIFSVCIGYICYKVALIYYIYRMISGVLIICLFMHFNYKKAPKGYLQNTFFTFCSHIFFFGPSTRLFAKFFGANGFTMLIGYFLSVFLTWTLTVISAEATKHFFPSLYAILTGGRTKERN